MGNSAIGAGLPSPFSTRFLFVLILFCCLDVNAHGYSQNVTFTGSNVSLRSVLTSIEKQTGISFFYNYELIKDARPLTLDLRDVPFETALKIVLKDLNLDFYRAGRTVFIVKRQNILTENPIAKDSAIDDNITISGKVVDQQGAPLVGASVVIVGGNKGTLTNEQGGFELKNVRRTSVLLISYSGYNSRKIVVDRQTTVVAELSLAQSTLDEAQVVAYGQTTMRFSTGDVTTVKGEDIRKQPVDNLLLSLEGRVPGLFVTEYSGVPGAAVTVTVQGQNSILAGNDPLYVVDGVPYSSYLLSNVGSSILGNSNSSYYNPTGSGSPLSFINPSDIESISVLKDADATAIYGSRAANGAILITTRKGKAGKTKVDMSLRQGIGQVAKTVPMMNTSEYLQMRRSALANDGVTPDPNTDYDLTFWDTTRYTDWRKKLIENNAQYTNAQINVSGGSPNVQYLVGASYMRQTTVFPFTFSDQKGSVHFNLNSTSSDGKFHLQLLANYLVDINRLPTTDLTGSAYTLAPDAPAIYNPDGSINWAPNSIGSSTWNNPFAAIINPFYQNKVNNLVSNLIAGYQLTRGLEIRTSFGYTNLQQNEISTSPLTALPPNIRSFIPRSAVYGNSNLNSYIIEPQLSYKRIIGDGDLSALLGTTIEQNNNTFQQLNGSGYNSDAVLKNVGSASTVTGAMSESVYRYNALFFRLGYNWGRKYILNLSGRRDGSSRFGANNQFHDFGSIGAAWIFSEEKAIHDNFKFLSFGKLRASFGTTGNDQIGDYKFLSLYNPVTAGIPYQGAGGLTISGLSNPYLQWETTKKLQIGVDLGFLKDRILVNGAWYRNRSSNELLSYQLPVNSGFGSIVENFPATLQNYGVEITANTVNIRTKSFSWTSTINITVPRNKLLSFKNISTSTYKNTYVVGKPFIGLTSLYRYAGVNPTTGEYQFYDSKGNLTYNPSAVNDMQDTAYISPRYYGGVDNKISYKGFEFDVLLQFVKQPGFNNYAGNGIPGLFNVNQPKYILGSWQKPGDFSAHQRYNQDYTFSNQWTLVNQSNVSYSDASYIRVKNVSLSWEIPSRWRVKTHIQESRIFLQGQNLFTITGYKGMDPESQSLLSLPPLRVVTVGLQVAL